MEFSSVGADADAGVLAGEDTKKLIASAIFEKLAAPLLGSAVFKYLNVTLWYADNVRQMAAEFDQP